MLVLKAFLEIGAMDEGVDCAEPPDVARASDMFLVRP